VYIGNSRDALNLTDRLIVFILVSPENKDFYYPWQRGVGSVGGHYYANMRNGLYGLNNKTLIFGEISAGCRVQSGTALLTFILFQI
jgi:hypothetical protein